MPSFTRLSLYGWRQFGRVDIDLTKQVVILTGANGTGKTSILSLLSKHFGWNLSFAATPFVSKRQRKRLFRDIAVEEGVDGNEGSAVKNAVGEISYDNGAVCNLTVADVVESSYQVQFANTQAIDGLFIPSHRQQASYAPVSTIPTEPTESHKIYQNYKNIISSFYLPGDRRVVNPGRVQKESLISLAVFGEGNAAVAGNDEYRAIFEEFQSRLKIVLPKDLGFIDLKIVLPEVVLRTETGNFSLDAMSGGVASVFNTVWQIHMFEQGKSEYTIILDEPENHLHPSMQRSLLPALALAFPRAKFIVASHSPFIVSSFRDACVNALYRDESGRVISRELQDAELSGSANSILRDILGVDNTLPLWAEKEIEEELRRTEKLSPRDRASELMKKMNNLGILDSGK